MSASPERPCPHPSVTYYLERVHRCGAVTWSDAAYHDHSMTCRACAGVAPMEPGDSTYADYVEDQL